MTTERHTHSRIGYQGNPMTPEVVLVYTEMDIGLMDPAHRLLYPTYARYSYI